MGRRPAGFPVRLRPSLRMRDVILPIVCDFLSSHAVVRKDRAVRRSEAHAQMADLVMTARGGREGIKVPGGVELAERPSVSVLRLNFDPIRRGQGPHGCRDMPSARSPGRLEGTVLRVAVLLEPG